jgi:hypothetical protein
MGMIEIGFVLAAVMCLFNHFLSQGNDLWRAVFKEKPCLKILNHAEQINGSFFNFVSITLQFNVGLY